MDREGVGTTLNVRGKSGAETGEVRALSQLVGNKRASPWKTTHASVLKAATFVQRVNVNSEIITNSERNCIGGLARKKKSP